MLEKYQPYIGDHEGFFLRIRYGHKPAAYYIADRGKNKGRLKVNHVNHYTWLTHWCNRNPKSFLKLQAHRTFRHQTKQALATARYLHDFDECVLPYRVAFSSPY